MKPNFIDSAWFATQFATLLSSLSIYVEIELPNSLSETICIIKLRYDKNVEIQVVVQKLKSY